jgi:murein DD-endopeptidase MepM/ murein hydrolase activator NlpD
MIHPGQRLDLSAVGVEDAHKLGQSRVEFPESAPHTPNGTRTAEAQQTGSLPPLPAGLAPAEQGGPVSEAAPPLQDKELPPPAESEKSYGGLSLGSAKAALESHKDHVEASRERLAALRDRSQAELRDASAMIQALLESNSALARATGDGPWRQLLGGGPARLSSSFGMRDDPFTGLPQHHNGIDIAAPAGTRIYPLKSGRVTFSGWDGGYGRVVIVAHDDGTETRYGHNLTNYVEVGDLVTRHTPVGEVGSTGRSTGPHLHFEMRVKDLPVDPVPRLKPDGLEVAAGL